jgi:hypothetical protein
MNNDNQTSPNLPMREHGFSPSENRGGARWYSRPITYEGKEALLAVKNDAGIGLPQSLQEPVRVGIHDLQTGEEIRSKRYRSLEDYLDAIDKAPAVPLP